MKVIAISKKKFKELKPMKISKYISNTEGKIYDFRYRNEDKVIKALYTLDGPNFANKLYTIEMLDYNRKYLPTSFLIPDSLCTVNGEVIGPVMTKFNGLNLSDVLRNPNIGFEEKKYYLIKIGELLEQLKNIRTYTPLNDIYINDLHAGNFIVDLNKRELKVLDLDSCKISDNKVTNIIGGTLIDYVDKYKKSLDSEYFIELIPDENSDLFRYNLMLLNYLFDDRILSLKIDGFYEYLNYLENIGIDKHLINSFSKILDNCDNENPMYYLESLTLDQTIMANRKTYEKIKSKVLR